MKPILSPQALRLAALTYRVPAGLVAAILADEAQRYDLWDGVQDQAARWFARLSPTRRAPWIRRWEVLTREPLGEQSFGPAQMNLNVAEELVCAGYMPVPDAYSTDPLGLLLTWLEEPARAPHWVAARLRQTIDHWAARGVKIGDNAPVLATLYSIGLTSARGVHPNPEPNARGLAICAHSLQFEKEVGP